MKKLLDAERDEVGTHEATIYSIFINRYIVDINQQLYKEFMKSMELGREYIDAIWTVEKEHFIGDGRIDLFYKSLDGSMAVVVELKIDAGDQDRQLSRYYQYLLDAKYIIVMKRG